MSAPSEFFVDLCFIRSHESRKEPMKRAVDEAMSRMFTEGHIWSTSYRMEEGLDIVTAEANGLSPWGTEEEVLVRLEESLSGDCLEWLQGYRVHVITKEDVGPCQLKCKPRN
ncbi:hypothetical protein [Paenibacillus silviterrae]|uniref:hypothetical protein n=1 Tax=Paenibacillus silviterrae TaxID=3242194 RepID=UPI00254276F8|nr:hypothetical protein [Paenibacillus chinjuensis]